MDGLKRDSRIQSAINGLESKNSKKVKVNNNFILNLTNRYYFLSFVG
jgi:hypothetical protein